MVDRIEGGTCGGRGSGVSVLGERRKVHVPRGERPLGGRGGRCMYREVSVPSVI